jgi:hypothetical protein
MMWFSLSFAIGFQACSCAIISPATPQAELSTLLNYRLQLNGQVTNLAIKQNNSLLSMLEGC